MPDEEKEPREDVERVPLKTILQNFLNHVETLEARKNDGENTYEKEFQSLKAFSDGLKSIEQYSTKEGEKEVNRKKNRYKDILPFDYTRVFLSEYPGVPGSDYINANYIKGASGSNAYIASQGPLPHTVNDFWRMVVECEVQVIVMACNEQEGGKHKCEGYWNEDEDEERQYGKFFVKLLKSRDICPDFLVRTMRLRWTNDDGKDEDRTVCQFHYSAWPDHGIPTQVKPLLEMVRLIRDCQASETLPVLIHCSAGCGRTGTICAIDFIWGLLRTGKLTRDFSLYELVRDMRRQRIAMVQTVDQYILVHRAVRELFLEQMRVIDSHPYENVDGDGHPLCKNPDEITPDYETIFVKSLDDHEDIDKILSQRMSQQRPLMGTAMLPRPLDKKEEGDTTPPYPPPKQRLPLDSTILESSRQISGDDSTQFAPVEEFTRGSSEPGNLLDPAKPPECSETAPQRFKKGNLRLMQTDDGGWKLEELAEEKAAIEAKRSDGKKKKKSKDGDESPKTELLRKPSIKKLRAFFNKDKSEKPEVVSDSEEPPVDPEYMSAVSKLPKFEQLDVNDVLPVSKSVPSSLDRKAARKETESTNTESNDGSVGRNNNLSKYWPMSSKRSEAKKSSEKSDKPLLPIKRSKSMKAVTKPVSVIPVIDDQQFKLYSKDGSGEEAGSPTGFDTYPKSKSRSEKLSSSTDDLKDEKSSDQFQSMPSSNQRTYLFGEEPPPPKPRRLNNTSAVRIDYLTSSADFIDPAKIIDKEMLKTRLSDYVNLRLRRDMEDMSPEEIKREQFLEQNLAKLHARTGGKEEAATPKPSSSAELKDSLPLILKSSEVLDDSTKRMLKDCQDYLMATFDMAEKESERLLQSRTRSSNESSPMTTLQFSAQSSPGNSFNKYNKVVSPPGTIQKSVSSPTGTIQKNFCSPIVESRSESGSSPTQECRGGGSSNAQSHEYANVNPALEAQKKLAASSAGPRTRERRNSFRQAVEDGSTSSGQPVKKAYESIWFGQDEDQSGEFGVSPSKSPRSDDPPPRTEDPAYANTSSFDPHYVNASFQRSNVEKVQLRPKTRVNITTSNAVSGTYENVSISGDPPSSGYEVVNFKDGRLQQRSRPTNLLAPSSRPKPLVDQRSSSGSKLQSVGLVAEVINNKKPGLTKQDSSSSLRSQPPPPYKQPPQPQQMRVPHIPPTGRPPPPLHYRPQHEGNRLPPVYNHPYQQNQKPPDLPRKENSSSSLSSLYANVPRRHSRESASSLHHHEPPHTQDDIDLTLRKHVSSSNNRRSASQIATNRLSLGDFSLISTVQSLPPNNTPGFDHGSPQSSLDGSTVAHGVDLDTVAAMMQGGSKENISSPGHKPLGRTIAGVLSGAAANLRSRLSNLGGLPGDVRSTPSPPTGYPSRTPSQVELRAEMSVGERSPSTIPLTVPGADAAPNQLNYSYPHRLESRPFGPRDPPLQFQRKQEYL